MSLRYNMYLAEHKENTARAFGWMKKNLPEVILDMDGVDYEHQICFAHDESKTNPDEYDAYDAYFYGNNKSHEVISEFNRAWLMHIHRNPHHWQHWVLIKDDPGEANVVLEMPYNYIIEMICDWWSFGWRTGNLTELFTWYDKHRGHILMGNKTRAIVESILAKIKIKLDEDGGYENVR